MSEIDFIIPRRSWTGKLAELCLIREPLMIFAVVGPAVLANLQCVVI